MKLIKNLERLKLGFIVLGVIGLKYLDVNLVPEIRWFAGILIGVVSIFIVTAVLRNVLSQLKTLSGSIENHLKRKIDESIKKENDEKDYRKRSDILKEREILYDQLLEVNIMSFHKSLIHSFSAMILIIVLSFLPNLEIFNSGIFILHIIYFLLFYGLYHIMKVVLVFNEIINQGLNKS